MANTEDNQQIPVDEEKKPIRLDYSLQTSQERVKLVKQLLEETPKSKLTHSYLELLSDYVISAMDKDEKKSRKILTDNRMATVNKRETSYEGLVGKLENGEDGIYNLMNNNKNTILTPKVSITPKDLAEIPELQVLCDAIKVMEQLEKNATGKRKFILKKQLIEMHKDQYVIKNAFKKPMYAQKACHTFEKIDFDDDIEILPDGTVVNHKGISLFDPKHISAILCNYSNLKQDSWGRFNEDTFYMMEEVDELVEETLKDKYPLYYDLLVYKIDGLQNIEIQKKLEDTYGIKHSVEYISSLWRNKIPKLIADKAQEKYLTWYYTVVEKGKFKRCSRCGVTKLAINRYFSKNKTSKDGWYSICKECRNSKNKIKKEEENK